MSKPINTVESYCETIKAIKPLKNFVFTSIDPKYAYGYKQLKYTYDSADGVNQEWNPIVPVRVHKHNFKSTGFYPSPRLERFYDAMHQINKVIPDYYVFPIDAPSTFVNATGLLTLTDIRDFSEIKLPYHAWSRQVKKRIPAIRKKRHIKPFTEVWETLVQKFKENIRQTEETESSYSGVSRPIRFELYYHGKWIKKEVTTRLLLHKLKYK